MTCGELFLATVDQLDGYRVEAYHGIISVHVSGGINFVRGWFIALRDLVGGRVGTFENEAVRLEERAKRELCERVRQMPDVNAVIGLQFTYHHIGQQRKSMLALTVNGTVCRVRRVWTQDIVNTNVLGNTKTICSFLDRFLTERRFYLSEVA